MSRLAWVWVWWRCAGFYRLRRSSIYFSNGSSLCLPRDSATYVSSLPNAVTVPPQCLSLTILVGAGQLAVTCSLVFGILIVLWGCTNQLWSLLAKCGWSGVVKFGFGAAIQGSSAPLYVAGTKDLEIVPLMLILSIIISTLPEGTLLVSRLPSCLLPLPLDSASDEIQQYDKLVRKSSIQPLWSKSFIDSHTTLVFVFVYTNLVCYL